VHRGVVYNWLDLARRRQHRVEAAVSFRRVAIVAPQPSDAGVVDQLL